MSYIMNIKKKSVNLSNYKVFIKYYTNLMSYCMSQIKSVAGLNGSVLTNVSGRFGRF